VILDDKIEPHKQPVQKNGKPNQQQTLDFKDLIEKIASDKNCGFPCNRSQLDKKDEFIRKYTANGAQAKKELDLYLESTKNRKRTAGGFFDVSSSEVDFLEFSIDELAAHVENLTAELRAL